MIRIEHVALWTEDIDRLAAFYKRHLRAEVGNLYENQGHGFQSRFLTFESGARLEVMRSTSLSPTKHEPGAQRMGLTHIALSLGSEAQVDELTRAMHQMGVPVLDEPHRTGDGYYESVVLDPDGNRIELTA
jgi:lactoylglutathione lyase